MSAFPETLAACWHPVAYAHEVTDKPFATTLLEEALVIWRSADGAPHAMKDLCIHRGTALSLGWVSGDELVCGYHGWRYNAEGACTLIPQKANPTVVPTKARIRRYLCMERYGLIWVLMGETARYALPEIPEFENGEWKVVNTGPFTWASDASRQVENFTDFGHFPWVHPGLLGDVTRPVVPEHSVEVRGHVLHYTVVRPEAPNSDDFKVFANEQTVKPERRSRYELHLPYTIALRLGWGGVKGMVYFFVSQPMRRNQSRGYCIIGRNYDLEQPDSVLQGFEDTILGRTGGSSSRSGPSRCPSTWPTNCT